MTVDVDGVVVAGAIAGSRRILLPVAQTVSGKSVIVRAPNTWPIYRVCEHDVWMRRVCTRLPHATVQIMVGLRPGTTVMAEPSATAEVPPLTGKNVSTKRGCSHTHRTLTVVHVLGILSPHDPPMVPCTLVPRGALALTVNTITVGLVMLP